MSLNSKQCWNQLHVHASKGEPQCGKHGTGLPGGDKPYNDDVFPVTGCVATFPGSGIKALTVNVWADLNEDTDDESFGIDNVVVQRIRPGASWLYR